MSAELNRKRLESVALLYSNRPSASFPARTFFSGSTRQVLAWQLRGASPGAGLTVPRESGVQLRNAIGGSRRPVDRFERLADGPVRLTDRGRSTIDKSGRCVDRSGSCFGLSAWPVDPSGRAIYLANRVPRPVKRSAGAVKRPAARVNRSLGAVNRRSGRVAGAAGPVKRPSTAGQNEGVLRLGASGYQATEHGGAERGSP